MAQTPLEATSETTAKPRKRSKPWEAKLTRSLTLKDGRKLIMPADARDILIPYFETMTKSVAVARAIELLLVAAASGKFADRKAATDQLAIVLAHRTVY